MLLDLNKSVSVELLVAGVCNLNCNYCYIPKNEHLPKIHKKVLDKIKSGTYLNEIKELYGDNLEVISHWGTEPTLTLSEFKDFYKQVVKEFPKLERISLSSNFMTDSDIISDFIINFPQTDKVLRFDIQCSLDGPPEITDNNRLKGSTDKIYQNLKKFVYTLNVNSEKFKNCVQLMFKSTIDSKTIKYLSEYENLKKYYEFFNGLILELKEANFNKKILIIGESCCPTIVVPGRYTKQDGINAYNLIRNQKLLNKNKEFNIKIVGMYEGQFEFMMRHHNDMNIYTKHRYTGCSAGKSCLALDADKNIQSCHRSYFFSSLPKEDIKEFYKDNPYYLGFDLDREDLLKNCISNYENEDSRIKYFYYVAAGADFIKMKFNSVYVLIKELALSNQISKDFIYNDHMARLFSVFLTCTWGCYYDNILGTGSILLIPTTIIKIFGNGVFQEYYNDFYERQKNVERKRSM